MSEIKAPQTIKVSLIPKNSAVKPTIKDPIAEEDQVN
jgi:hypothetical protein